MLACVSYSTCDEKKSLCASVGAAEEAKATCARRAFPTTLQCFPPEALLCLSLHSANQSHVTHSRSLASNNTHPRVRKFCTIMRPNGSSGLGQAQEEEQQHRVVGRATDHVRVSVPGRRDVMRGLGAGSLRWRLLTCLHTQDGPATSKEGQSRLLSECSAPPTSRPQCACVRTRFARK
jgi:hypothetical protein